MLLNVVAATPLDAVVYGEIKHAKRRAYRERMSRGGLANKQRKVMESFPEEQVMVLPPAEDEFSPDDLRQAPELLNELVCESTDNERYREFVRRAYQTQQTQTSIANDLGINPNTARNFLCRFCTDRGVLPPRQARRKKRS